MTAEAGSRPLVTVLMAVHNGARFVDEAIASILHQTFTDFEFLIVDDGSTDDTPRRIAGYSDGRIRVVRNALNLGLTPSLNRGLALARGTLVARQDADDISHPRRLEAQVAFLRQRADVAVVGTQARMIDGRGRPVRTAPWPKSTSAHAIRWQLMFDSPFVHTSVMFRRDAVWCDVHGYDETFVTSQDFELWCRVAAAGHEMRNLPDVLVDFRLHDASVSRRYDRESVARVGPVLLGALVAQLGRAAVPPGWPDMWVRASNPQLFPDAESPRTVAAALETIHEKFVARYGRVAGSDEITRHLAAMLVRVALRGAERGRTAALAIFARACRLDPAIAFQTVPRFAAQLALGPWRRTVPGAPSERPAAAEDRSARTLVQVGRIIYRNTPFRWMRQLYFRAFCRMMRDRRVRATVNGSTFELDLGEMIDLALYVGQYELDVTDALHRYCRPGMTVLDIGANIGSHTLTLGRLVTGTGAVYAFEPIDYAFEKLRRNVALNDAVQIHPIKAAVSDRNARGQEVAYRASWTTAGGRNDGTARTDFVRLDDWSARNDVDRVGLIKIDIDGNEFEALAGGAQLIARSRPVIVIEAVSPHFSDDARNPFVLLSSMGYRFRDSRSHDEYRSASAVARLLPANDPGMTVSINLVAIPPGFDE